MRGRLIPSPSTSKTRPTGSRTREALFNILQTVDGYRVLDLFAGSGIMGMEALSRGAESVVAVEMAHSQAMLILQGYKSVKMESRLTLLEKNVLTLPRESLCVLNGDGSIKLGFDLIYADPPFTEAYPDLRCFIQWLNPGGVAVFEAPSRNLPNWAEDDAKGKIASKIRRYGESSLLFYYADL